ncbi:MAG: fimbrial protein FimV [Herbaspirillum sp.]|nr:fimbrial protein FimV [Herbaspirillum sp.]
MHLITSTHTPHSSQQALPHSLLHSSPHSSLSRLKQISAAVILTCLLPALLPAGADAATLGKLTVLSAIGQPLNAEVALQSVSPQEKQSLAVKLAPQQAFSQANVEFNPALSALRFAIETRGTAQVVHITSVDGFNEPFVDALLELSGPNTPRVVREYSFLLDPPQSAKENAAQITPMADANINTTPAPKTAPSQAEPKSDAKAASKTAAKSAAVKSAAAVKTAKTKAAPSEYKVKQGDSLSEIANHMRPPGVSLDQMLVAMYRANPDAFTGENMSRMRAGKVLSVPDAAAASALARPEATSIVVAQAQDFSAYRNQLAGHVAGGAAKKTGAAAQTAKGKITAKVEERSTPAGVAKDKLQLSKGGVGNGMTSEDKIAADKAARDDASRIKDLEKNVGDLQKLLEIKNQNLAELSGQKTATPPTTTPAAAPASASDAMPAPKPVLAPPVPKPDFFEGWRDNPMLLPGGGLLAAILLAWAAYRTRRKPTPGAFDAGTTPDSDAPSPVVPPAAPVAHKELTIDVPVAAVPAVPEPEAAIEPRVTVPTPVVAEPVIAAPLVADPIFASDETAALAAAQKEAAEQQAKRDAEEALKIDLSRLAEPAELAATAATAPLDMSKLDFDLELDQESPTPAASAAVASPAIDLAAGLAAQSVAKPAEKPAEKPLEPRPEVKAVPIPAAPAGLPPAIEELNLDLSDPVEALETEADAAPAEEGDEDETSSYAKEINTKLDLAAAYQEIGDKDGARELLDEVVKAGNRRQMAKAQEMLGELV